ncbi:MAG: hypothetical protein U9P49_13850 [Thermodesulfobacteriota bacterium]|nr:hypothetical protein [Thermodesulfobacteriota bacterium]
MTVLHVIAGILATPLEFREQLGQILKKLSASAGMEHGMISILDRETGDVILNVTHSVFMDLG